MVIITEVVQHGVYGRPLLLKLHLYHSVQRRLRFVLVCRACHPQFVRGHPDVSEPVPPEHHNMIPDVRRKLLVEQASEEA